MISCEDCQKYLEAFLDAALEVRETLDVQEHLQWCKTCADRAEAERYVRAFIRQQAAIPPLPEARKRAIIRCAMRAAHPAWGWLRAPLHAREVALALAAAAAVFLLLLNPFSSPVDQSDFMQQLAREALLTYKMYTTEGMPLEIASADDRQVVAWAKTRLASPLKIPCITEQATRLLGGRLCRLLDRKSLALVYQRQGRHIVLFAFKNKPLALPRHRLVRAGGLELYVQTVEGRPVALWQSGEVTYSMVGDLDRDTLLHVASTIDFR
ncbi:MAG: hypothetical protein KatS3mg131_1037 [Candidatus Tectimicrobiota bacterium]|nr:MAG: hypothetical protein KatS3mg131_1037 [Candidatus Tectomicrobia bacterium]